MISGIAVAVPERVQTNEDFQQEDPSWNIEKIVKKTGIEQRHIADSNEYASDLAISAAQELFSSKDGTKEGVNFVLLCTQSPDYLLPTTACIIQDKLGLPSSVGAFDFNLGCSGYVYGLGIAKGLIETRQADSVLLLTADTYSKYLEYEDRSLRTIFGDAATATLISGIPLDAPAIGPFVYGTDGAGAENLMIRAGGCRDLERKEDHFLRMNGGEIFTFTMNAVPSLVRETLAKANISLDEVDWFVFHQANRFMIDHLRTKIGIPQEKFVVCMRDFGNTVSSSIPIALRMSEEHKHFQAGDKIMLVGFGVGYSWGAAIIHWNLGND